MAIMKSNKSWLRSVVVFKWLIFYLAALSKATDREILLNKIPQGIIFVIRNNISSYSSDDLIDIDCLECLENWLTSEIGEAGPTFIFKCLRCNQKLKKRSDIADHSCRIHFKVRFQCHKCPYVNFARQQDLYSHFKERAGHLKWWSRLW